MLTYALMGILVLWLALSSLWGIKFDSNKNSFMSIEDTVFLRGFWCIIVVLVHVPADYHNRIQDMLGSFAYIGVTFFFMTSAYGLKWSIDHKVGYMDGFWRRRLPPILVPALIASAFNVAAKGINGDPISVLSFLNINNWIKVLLLYYVVFWVIYGLLPRKLNMGGAQDFIMCLVVLVLSLIDYFTKFKITMIWVVEPLGFAYGILAAKWSESIRKWMSRQWLIKCISLGISAGILGIAYLKFKPVFFWGEYMLKLVLGIAITLFMYEVLSKLKVGNRVNAFLGSISYEVYILNVAVFKMLMSFGVQWNSGQMIITALVVTVLLAWILKQVSGLILKRIR